LEAPLDNTMIDKICYKFFAKIDNVCEWIANKLAGPRCKCGKKKK
jgi:phage tail protein X